MDLRGRESFILAIIPFHEVGIWFCERAKAGQFAGMFGALQRAGEDFGECLPTQSLAEKARGLFTMFGERQIRSTRMLAALAPGGFAMAREVKGREWRFLHAGLYHYHFNSCNRRDTSSALARLLNALMRKNPSPLEPKPEPGVMTTFASFKILSNACQLVVLLGARTQM